MDYGYQILRHVLQQVFGNFGAAARITLPLLMIPLVILLVTNPDVFTGQSTNIDPITGAPGFPDFNVAGLLIGALAALVGWIWAAVAWHRFVLLEEYPTGILPAFRGSNIGNYFGNAILVGLIVMAVAFLVAIVIGIITVVLQSPAVAIAIGVGLVIGVSWLATRIGLILPAAAISERLTIGESWRATKPVSGQILLPIIVIALASAILTQLIIALFGESTSVDIGGIPQQQIQLSMAGVVLNALVSWVQMLVNLALMTTLYGNLIEGRQLN